MKLVLFEKPLKKLLKAIIDSRTVNMETLDQITLAEQVLSNRIHGPMHLVRKSLANGVEHLHTPCNDHTVQEKVHRVHRVAVGVHDTTPRVEPKRWQPGGVNLQWDCLPMGNLVEQTA